MRLELARNTNELRSSMEESSGLCCHVISTLQSRALEGKSNMAVRPIPPNGRCDNSRQRFGILSSLVVLATMQNVSGHPTQLLFTRSSPPDWQPQPRVFRRITRHRGDALPVPTQTLHCVVNYSAAHVLICLTIREPAPKPPSPTPLGLGQTKGPRGRPKRLGSAQLPGIGNESSKIVDSA